MFIDRKNLDNCGRRSCECKYLEKTNLSQFRVVTKYCYIHSHPRQNSIKYIEIYVHTRDWNIEPLKTDIDRAILIEAHINSYMQTGIHTDT